MIRSLEKAYMGRGKMDEAAAARIRKARGDKVTIPRKPPADTEHAKEGQDEFARRATIAARANKENSGKDDQQGGKDGGSNDGKQGDANSGQK